MRHNSHLPSADALTARRAPTPRVCVPPPLHVSEDAFSSFTSPLQWIPARRKRPSPQRCFTSFLIRFFLPRSLTLQTLLCCRKKRAEITPKISNRRPQYQSTARGYTVLQFQFYSLTF
ncbi:hypothetical protein ZIOFF_014617 [Zingiber officinale]|uniref:Uncharacterized protein n=1 Tax=Zingiber officinale TaxID=94328 RepID=A0A8J5HHM2_ZINOF|nr:hypothetical protein ZIOFF_014617 [Zingiber officinale]